jgi:hypothetical protein
MSKFYNTYSNTNQNHPLQHNSQSYLPYKKYVSIHSEDRDAISYPNSSEFEIELPEDVTNISTMKLVDWSFPSNYNTFSVLNSNITMIFIFANLYNPNTYNINDPLENAIFQALNTYTYNNNYIVTIEEGFYNPSQLAKELTNKFNEVVTNVIIAYFTNTPSLTYLLESFINSGGYSRFSIVYNNVSQKIWFGNSADSFELLNETIFIANSNVNEQLLCKKTQVPDFSNWGLPGNLGLTRCNTSSSPPPNLLTYDNGVPINNNYLISNNYMRFYYGDVNVNNCGVGDNGYWLTPATDTTGNLLPGAVVQFIECPYKINIFGPSYIYMEIFKYNCIDETQPYNISAFTLTTNETNGIVNSAFAKIPIVSTPISQYYDGPSNSYKFFDPPVERIRRLKFRLRYHNGELVNFGVFEYTFTLEFTTLLPMINRAVNYVNPSTF